MRVYAQSKLANMLHTCELAKRLHDSNITVNCLHPGAVRTRLGRDGEQSRLGEMVWSLASRFLLTPEQGALTSLWAVTDPGLADVTGAYFAKEKVASPRDSAIDVAAASRLWRISEELTA